MATTPQQNIAFIALPQRDLSRDKNLLAGYAQIDFATGPATQVLDLLQAEQFQRISAILGMFIDNSDNLYQLAIQFSSTFQTLKIPAGAQALLPISSQPPEKIKFSTLGGSIVPVQLYNFRPDPLVWVAASGGTGPGSPTWVRDLTQNPMTWGNVALGADQVIVPANVNRQTIIVKAAATNTGPAFINFGAAAAANSMLQLDPGDYLIQGDPGNVDPRDLHIFGTAPDRVSFGFV